MSLAKILGEIVQLAAVLAGNKFSRALPERHGRAVDVLDEMVTPRFPIHQCRQDVETIKTGARRQLLAGQRGTSGQHVHVRIQRIGVAGLDVSRRTGDERDARAAFMLNRA